MLPDTEIVTPEQLVLRATAKLHDGYRFVTMTCNDEGEQFDLIYHFDVDYKLSNLRVKLPKDAECPSISRVYFAAVVIENEIKDLFGVKFTGLAIDYGGRLIMSENGPKTPQLKLGPTTRLELHQTKPADPSKAPQTREGNS